jgi:hypothetical protein
MNNEHEGKGGSYVVGGDGQVNLVERTKQPGEEPVPDEPAPAESNKTTRAAKAALSSPAAPADQPSKEQA